jgi:hypothetical protein
VRHWPGQSGRSWDHFNAIYSLQGSQTKCTWFRQIKLVLYQTGRSYFSLGKSGSRGYLAVANQHRAFGMTLPPPGIASCAPNAPAPTPSWCGQSGSKRQTPSPPVSHSSNGFLWGRAQVVRTSQIMSESHQMLPSLSAHIDLYQSYVIDRYQTNPDSYQMSGIIRTLQCVIVCGLHLGWPDWAKFL